LDLVWYITLDGNGRRFAFENNTDLNVQINVSRNVFLLLEVFGADLIESKFTMVPEVGITLPQAVIQCGVSNVLNSSIIHVDILAPRGM
jgi:hypothetical protein